MGIFFSRKLISTSCFGDEGLWILVFHISDYNSSSSVLMCLLFCVTMEQKKPTQLLESPFNDFYKISAVNILNAQYPILMVLQVVVNTIYFQLMVSRIKKNLSTSLSGFLSVQFFGSVSCMFLFCHF